MQYYQCECGNLQSYGSMGPSPCAKCNKCGSGVGFPGFIPEAKEHNWIATTVETDNGDSTLTRCSWCGIKRTHRGESTDSAQPVQ